MALPDQRATERERRRRYGRTREEAFELGKLVGFQAAVALFAVVERVDALRELVGIVAKRADEGADDGAS